MNNVLLLSLVGFLSIICLYGIIAYVQKLPPFKEKYSISVLPNWCQCRKNEYNRIKHYKNDKKNQMIQYLSSVYPLAANKFKKMHMRQLDEFYNSLWFYYNCDYSGKAIIKDDENDNTVYSKKTLSTTKEKHVCWDKIYNCGISLPYAPDGVIYSWSEWWKNRNPMIISSKKNNYDIKTLGGSIPGQTFLSKKMGPSPVWQYARAIFRNIYTDPKFINDRIPKLLKGSIEQLNPPFKIPDKWWLGVKSESYIEVNAASEPGLALSCCPMWYDGWKGSGVFLNVGKTIIARNKSNAVYLLASEMEKCEISRQKLVEWFNADTAKKVLKNIYSCNITSPIFMIGGKKTSYNICSEGANVTNPSRLPKAGFNWDDDINASDMKKWCGSDKTLDECLDDVMYGGSYTADRLNTTIIWDEPIFAMASYLDYDTVQMTMSSNTSGFWQYEILDVRYAKNVVGVYNRDYSNFIVADSDIKSAFEFYFSKDFLNWYMNKITKHLSLRDPFDLSIETECNVSEWKDAHDISPPWEKHKTINVVCNNNISRIFSKLALTDCEPTCSRDTKC